MPQVLDAGKANHSPSAEFMELVNVHHDLTWTEFDEVVKFLQAHLDDIIKEVHGFDKLYLDDGKTMLNCPPPPDSDDSHGHELIRTLSEKQTDHGVAVKREIKVHDMGPDPDDATKRRIEIREDKIQAEKGDSDGLVKPVYSEKSVIVSIPHREHI